MHDVSSWLAGIGLGQYAQLFSDNAVDNDVLLDLTDADLAGLGIVLGHRKKILKAIEQLKRTDSPPAEEAERRLLTVMVCDLAGPAEMLRPYRQVCASVVAAYDGFVAQYPGDGLMV